MTQDVRRVALITGASAGIGLELARLMARAGYELALVARRADRLEALRTELERACSARVHVLPADLAAPGAVAALVEEIVRRDLRISDLVNNAGFGAYGAFETLDLARQLEMVRLNVLVLTELSHRLLPALRAARPGRILNVASTASFQPGPLMAVYFATKAYVLSFSEALARECATHGVTVTALCPGPTETEFGTVAGVPGSRLLPIVSMSAERVARAGLRGMERGRAVVIPGLGNWLVAQSVRIAPRALARRISHALNSSMKGKPPGAER